MSDKTVIQYLTEQISKYTSSHNTIEFDESILASAQSDEIKELCNAVKGIAMVHTKGFEAIRNLSVGNLDFDFPEVNRFFDPIKELQSQLKHLMQQTQCLASGDYSQQIEFLGQYSTSFNQLIKELQHQDQLKIQLAESDRNYRLIAENSKDVIWTIDLQTLRFTYISPSIYSLRGLTVQEAMNESLEQSLTPESLERVLNFLPMAIQLKQTDPSQTWTTGEYQQPRKDGTIIDVEINTSIIFNDRGMPSEILGISRDITRRKKIKQDLQASENLLKLIGSKTKDIIWLLDLNSHKLDYVSDSVFNFRGVTVEEALQTKVTDTLTPESRIKALDVLRQANAMMVDNNNVNALSGCEEYQQYHKDGHIIDIEVATVIINDELGNPQKMLGISRDITSRKEAQRALQASEMMFKMIAENTRDVIWKIDLPTFKYNYISPSVYQMRGYTVEEAVQQSVEESLTPESAIRATNTLLEYLTKTDFVNLYVCDEYQQPCKDGSLIDIELLASFIVDENNNPVEILGVTRDITNRKATEMALKDSEAKLTKLLARQTLKNKKLSSQLKYFFDNTINAIAFFHTIGDQIYFTECNKRWADQYNKNPEELEGINISAAVTPDDYTMYKKTIMHAINSGETIQELVHWRNYVLDTIIIPIKDDSSKVITQCAALIFNVTERIESERLLRESEEKFSSIFDNSSDAIVLLTNDMTIIDVNKRFFELSGYKQEDTPNKIDNLNKYVPDNYLQSITQRIELLSSNETVPAFECELITTNGTTIPIEINSTSYLYNNKPSILCMIRDISIRKQFEQQLTQIGIQIETRERRTLAVDLHDNVGPLLSSMNMYLSSLARKPALDPHIEMINDIRNILKEAITSVREISNNISPQVLTNFGLTSALQVYFESKRKLIQIELNNSIGDLRFDETKEIMMYNIIKEAFNNTLKYANASCIEIKIFTTQNKLYFNYHDNGIGFNLDQKLSSPSNNLGLLSIINRVKNMNGIYQMESSPEHGFSIKINFPITKELQCQN